MAALASLLPTPRYNPPTVHSDDEDDSAGPSSAPSTALATVTRPYGARKGWRPSRQEEYGDGGAYPECSIAQYPLDMGRKKVGPSIHFVAFARVIASCLLPCCELILRARLLVQ
jgi:SNW domain-containing protein 1